MIRACAAAALIAVAALRGQVLFGQVLFEDAQAERVATGLVYPDGMVWAREGFLAFTDVAKKTIYRLDPPDARGQISGPKPTKEDSNAAQGLSYDTQARLYICEPGTRRLVRMDRRGALETLVDGFEGKKLNSPNDVIVRHDGHVYFTDPAFGSAADARELDFNGVFHLGPKGEVEAVAKWKTRPNGIALSADGRILYVGDADRHAVVAFDVDGRGAVSNPRDLIRNISGVPNGIRTDVAGRLYVGAKGLGVYSADGKLLRTLLAEETVTNCAFGDNDFETLYVAGRKAIYKIRLGVKGALQY